MRRILKEVFIVLITKARDIFINAFTMAMLLLLIVLIYMQIGWLKGFEMHVMHYSEELIDSFADRLFRDRVILHVVNFSLVVLSLTIGFRTINAIKLKK